jgi:hypothetical protein
MRSRRTLHTLPLALAVIASAVACQRTALPAVVNGTAVPNVVAPASGRGSVVGFVADSTSGYPVIGASVYFTADSVIGVGPARPRTDLPRATTDQRGGFALRDLVPGRYTIAFADLDHFPMRQLAIVHSDQVRTVVFRPARRARP